MTFAALARLRWVNPALTKTAEFGRPRFTFDRKESNHAVQIPIY